MINARSLALVAALLSVAATASAQSPGKLFFEQRFLDSFAFATTDIQGSLALPAFNNPGSLDSVQVCYSGGLKSSGTLKNTAANTNTFNGTVFANLQIFGPTPESSLGGANPGAVQCTFPPFDTNCVANLTSTWRDREVAPNETIVLEEVISFTQVAQLEEIPTFAEPRNGVNGSIFEAAPAFLAETEICIVADDAATLAAFSGTGDVDFPYATNADQFFSGLGGNEERSTSTQVSTMVEVTYRFSTTPSPTASPTSSPTESPTESPTNSPTESPTSSPTSSPTTTFSPTLSPTDSPTVSPTQSPTTTASPTVSPTAPPTSPPTDTPTPTASPTESPTESPTASPTQSPTSSPTQTGGIKNDPHLVGFSGQRYDVTGEVGSSYALISDSSLAVNARFATAWQTGLSVDPASGEAVAMFARGTWMSEISVLTPEHVVELLIDTECDSADADCDRRIVVDGDVVPRNRTGAVFVSPSMTVVVGGSSAKRITLLSEALDATIDFVPPPAEWGVDAADRSSYSHLNLRVDRASLSSHGHGLLGVSRVLKRDASGAPVLRAFDKDGGGVIDGTVDDYRLTSLLDTAFRYSSFETAAASVDAL